MSKYNFDAPVKSADLTSQLVTKVQAIKIFRKLTGVPLAESRAIIEQNANSLNLNVLFDMADEYNRIYNEEIEK